MVTLAVMQGNDYWVGLSCNGRRLGAGLLLTRCYVLTAFHCVSGMGEDADMLDVLFASGECAKGRVHRTRPDADLALIDVPAAPVNLDFRADLARIGLNWYDPYRPDNDDVYLSGEVSAVPFKYRCAAGKEIEAIQLACSQLLGDYSGYSGSPVTRSYPDGGHGVIGILIEQYMERAADAQRSSNVLIATSVAEAGRSFDCLEVAHLLNVLYPQSSPASTSAPSSRPVGAGIRTPSAVAGRRGWLGGGRQSSQLRAGVSRVKAEIQTDRHVLNELVEVARQGLVDEQVISQLMVERVRQMAGRGLPEGS